jgi:hypothetical protein
MVDLRSVIKQQVNAICGAPSATNVALRHCKKRAR